MSGPDKIISDEEIIHVHGYANFGSMTPRDVVNDGVRKYAVGFTGGSTQVAILREHGLITKPYGAGYLANLTEKGKRYARAIYNTRTPDPAQIRADALRGALAIAQEAVAKRIVQIEEERGKPTFDIDVPQLMRWGAGKVQAEQIADKILALLDAPLSPPAVDGSPAPDAGGKEGV